jgi:hypothetical protein
VVTVKCAARSRTLTLLNVFYRTETQCRPNLVIRHLLEMDAHGQGQEHAWPGQITEKDVPGIDDWLADAEYSRPGCLITWYENDAINACFDEEAQHMGAVLWQRMRTQPPVSKLRGRKKRKVVTQ